MKQIEVEVIHGFKDKATGKHHYPRQRVVFDEVRGSNFIRQGLVRLIARGVSKPKPPDDEKPTVEPDEDEDKGESEEEPEDLDGMTKADLEELAIAYGIEGIKGTGSGGAIVKADLVKAIEAVR